MRVLLPLVILWAGCATTIGSPAAEVEPDARPIEFREPPEPKDGSGTALGCEGVTARGSCEDGSAVYCDLELGRLRSIDCQALLPVRGCVVDTGRGAICRAIEPDPNAGGWSTPCKDTQTTEQGYCTTDETAIFCDVSGAEPVTRQWHCPTEGLSCVDGQCALLDGDTLPDCGTLDFQGVCDGEVARWCQSATGPQAMDCAAAGKSCEVDTCAQGAYCCGEDAPVSEENECAQLGIDGICTDSGTVRYCLFDEIQDYSCDPNLPCQVDVCGPGAFCCPDATEPPSECQTLGPEGACGDDGVSVRFCLGNDDEDIIEYACDPGEVCQFDACSPTFAECCDI